MYAIVSAVEIATDAPLKAFTLSRIFCATDLSSISRRPVPSTSQTPACAMFHKPVASLPLKPRPRKRGTAITARCAGGADFGRGIEPAGPGFCPRGRRPGSSAAGGPADGS